MPIAGLFCRDIEFIDKFLIRIGGPSGLASQGPERALMLSGEAGLDVYRAEPGAEAPGTAALDHVFFSRFRLAGRRAERGLGIG